jgi:hypothetical protein
MTVAAQHTAETRKPARLGGMSTRGAFRGAQARQRRADHPGMYSPVCEREHERGRSTPTTSWVRRPGFRAKPIERTPILLPLPKQSFRSRKLSSLEIAWDRVLELDKDGCIKRKDRALERERLNNDLSPSHSPRCLVLGSGARFGHCPAHNEERSAAAAAVGVTDSAPDPSSGIREGPGAARAIPRSGLARRTLAEGMGPGSPIWLWSPASLLVGPTRPPLPLVVAGETVSKLKQPRLVPAPEKAFCDLGQSLHSVPKSDNEDASRASLYGCACPF